MNVIGFLENPATRARLYALAVILIPLLVAGGYLADGAASTILNILAVLTGMGTAGLARKHAKRLVK